MRLSLSSRLPLLAAGLIASLALSAAPSAAHFVWVTTLPAEADGLEGAPA